MPGHSGGFCSSLATVGLKCCGNQIEDDVNGDSAKIIAAVLTEMASLFPDKVMNLGCDETVSTERCGARGAKEYNLFLESLQEIADGLLTCLMSADCFVLFDECGVLYFDLFDECGVLCFDLFDECGLLCFV